VEVKLMMCGFTNTQDLIKPLIQKNAENMVQKIISLGYPGYRLTKDFPAEGTLHAVVAGDYPSLKDALIITFQKSIKETVSSSELCISQPCF
jgi:hypothetical protein